MNRIVLLITLGLALPAGAQPFPWIVDPDEPDPVVLPSISRLPARTAKPDVVLLWNEAALNAIKLERTPPPVAARNLAILHVSIYDAVNSIVRTHRAVHVQLTPSVDTSQESAAAVAGYQALVALYPKQLHTFNAILDEALASILTGNAKSEGIILGKKVAAKVLAWRQDDLKEKKSSYTPKSEIGRWQPTPPDYKAALLPGWSSNPPFAIRRPTDFHPPAPPELKTEDFTHAYWEVKSLGGVKSTIRTKDQTEIAKFWADGPGTVTPPGHWNRIARTAAEAHNNTLLENARLFAMLNVALADAGIVCWDCKYKFDFWRPVVAIRKADSMNNPIVTSDPQWLPIVPTPPFPAYPSGHSTFSSAAAGVLSNFFGSDKFRFSSTSDDLPGVKRNFTSFTGAAREAGMSRIYGGIHWQFDNQEGLRCGEKVGNEVSKFFTSKPKPAVEELSEGFPPR
jgi:hypothetical protein